MNAGHTSTAADPRPVHRTRRRDAYAVGAAVLLVVTAVLAGRPIQDRLRVNWPPLLASWDPHVGPGTPAAVVLAAAVVAYGPVLAARLRWPALLVAVWATATAWILSLALVDGWQRGVAGGSPPGTSTSVPSAASTTSRPRWPASPGTSCCTRPTTGPPTSPVTRPPRR